MEESRTLREQKAEKYAGGIFFSFLVRRHVGASCALFASVCSAKLTRFATPPFSFNLLRSVKRGALRARKTKQACGRQVVRIAKAIRVALPASTTSERTMLRSGFSLQKNRHTRRRSSSFVRRYEVSRTSSLAGAKPPSSFFV